MAAIVHLSLLCVLGCEAPAMADIIENAQGIARIAVVETAPLAGTTVPGAAMAAEVNEAVWGAPPRKLSLWMPFSACERLPRAGELVVGFRDPRELERAHLRLPQPYVLLCGAAPAREGLCAAIRRLRQARDVESLMPLLLHAEPLVRRQAVRQLTERLGAGEPAALARLVPLAREETDPVVLHAYVAAFGHFRYGEAAPIVAGAVLRSDDDLVAGGAEIAFARIARPPEIAQIVAAYPAARLPVKARILMACARMSRPETQRLLEAALATEETVLPALEAIVAAGRPVPADVPRVRDPLRAQRIRLFLNRLRNRPGDSGEDGPETPRRAR